MRGFAPGGIGPRDISDPDNLQAAGLGGTTYFGGTAEVQFPIFGLPREIGLKGAVFTDAGTLFGYRGQTNFVALQGLPAGSAPAFATNIAPTYTQGYCIQVDDERIDPRLRWARSLIWASPLGPIRIDYAYRSHQGQIRPDAGHQFLGRQHLLSDWTDGRTRPGAPLRAARLFLLRIRRVSRRQAQRRSGLARVLQCGGRSLRLKMRERIARFLHGENRLFSAGPDALDRRHRRMDGRAGR